MSVWRWGDVVAVFVGGILGTAARFAIDLALPHDATAFPYGTLLVNVTGALVLGILVGGVWSRPVPSWLRAGVGPGVLGSFTTFSAIALAAVVMADAGAALLALAYVAVTLVVGVGAAFVGIALGTRLPAGGREAG